jgi:hypothetical protein
MSSLKRLQLIHKSIDGQKKRRGPAGMHLKVAASRTGRVFEAGTGPYEGQLARRSKAAPPLPGSDTLVTVRPEQHTLRQSGEYENTHGPFDRQVVLEPYGPP